MPLYENEKNAENRIRIPEKYRDAVVFETEPVMKHLAGVVKERGSRENRCMSLAFDGWYAVDWDSIIASFDKAASQAGLKTLVVYFRTCLKPTAEIDSLKTPFLSDDPSFGIVNDSGTISALTDKASLDGLIRKLGEIKAGKAPEYDAFVVYGSGSSIPELSGLYDIRCYFDTTKQSVLWNMWSGKIVPFGYEKPKKDFWWKEYYYNDFYLLNEQKHFAFKRMDFYIEGIDPASLKLVPREAFDAILSTLVRYPIKNVKYAQPGPWGAYRFKDTRWNMPELANNAWNSLIAPNELSMLIDFGGDKMLKMPGENLIHYPENVVGEYIHKTYPRLIPMYIWLDDGYFPEPQPAERTSMPIHNHPGTDYVNRHFNEPLGRYETYYIAEAFEGANTWMGFKEGADLEEWEALCRESEKTGKKIENWKDFVENWPTNTGDLFLIPPGTSHGHGGNQMVIEMDTVPSVAGTEYSFFGYDFVRNTWDDSAKSMTAKPMSMHIEHYFDNEKWRRSTWVRDKHRPRPKIIRWTKEYCIDRYDSLPEMPFEIERLHFIRRAEYDTQGKFMHMVVLSMGDKVIIKSKSHPERTCDIEWYQGACIPACFGEYEIVNQKEGMCTVVLIRWKKG